MSERPLSMLQKDTLELLSKNGCMSMFVLDRRSVYSLHRRKLVEIHSNGELVHLSENGHIALRDSL